MATIISLHISIGKSFRTYPRVGHHVNFYFGISFFSVMNDIQTNFPYKDNTPDRYLFLPSRDGTGGGNEEFRISFSLTLFADIMHGDEPNRA